MSAEIDSFPEPSLIDCALTECEDDAERVRFLRSQNDLLRAANVNLAKLCDLAVVTLHESGHHEEADRIERLASPW